MPAKCSLCEGRVKARGLCMRCYQRIDKQLRRDFAQWPAEYALKVPCPRPVRVRRMTAADWMRELAIRFQPDPHREQLRAGIHSLRESLARFDTRSV